LGNIFVNPKIDHLNGRFGAVKNRVALKYQSTLTWKRKWVLRPAGAPAQLTDTCKLTGTLAFWSDHLESRDRKCHVLVSVAGKETENWVNKNSWKWSGRSKRDKENKNHDRNHRIRCSNLFISISNYNKCRIDFTCKETKDSLILLKNHGIIFRGHP